jgi:hypothetical protein
MAPSRIHPEKLEFMQIIVIAIGSGKRQWRKKLFGQGRKIKRTRQWKWAGAENRGKWGRAKSRKGLGTP